MSKKIILMILVFTSLLLFSSCNIVGSGSEGEMIVSEEKQADARMEQIIAALKSKDKEALKSLFSNKALEEATSFEADADCLFELFQDNITSWERDGWSSSESVEYGKKSSMIRFAIDVETDKDMYRLFIIDYNTDTINPNNQGVFMLELIKDYGEKKLVSWQDRMRAGIYIH